MRPPPTTFAYPLIALALGAGCVEFNECESDRGLRLGAAGVDLDLRESVVRTQEAPVGNLVADGLLTMAETLCRVAEAPFPCPDIALQNAGGLRQETACGTRESIETGGIYEQDVLDLMPFENELIVVELTGRDVRLALERAVSALKERGEAGEAGYFLHSAGLRFDVDCDGQAHTLAADQSRVEREGNRVSNVFLVVDDETDIALDDAASYQVATNSFIGRGRDGFLSFLLRDEQDQVIVDDDGPVERYVEASDRVVDSNGSPVTDRFAVMDWIAAHEEAGITIGRPPEGRINIAPNCYGGQL
jgi:2',3'-cyclic-nucleotide 2'-phosphodiesterase (5'-nucleotidase family)